MNYVKLGLVREKIPHSFFKKMLLGVLLTFKAILDAIFFAVVLFIILIIKIIAFIVGKLFFLKELSKKLSTME